MSGWRYLAYRLNGDGTETQLHPDVPISGAKITDLLSGPGGITGTITPEIAAMREPNGLPIFQPWSTAIYAEADGHIRAGAILANMPIKGAELGLDCVGFTGYATRQPYTSELSKVQADPLDMARHIWEHIQAKPRHDIGLKLDNTKSPVRVGTKAENVEFTTNEGATVAFEAGPYKLNFFSNFDLGSDFDKLAKATPFDYRVAHAWSGDTISHTLKLGYPRLGRRLEKLRFMVGENILENPQIDYEGEDYASDVIVLGAGEGRKMIRSDPAFRSGETRLGRTVVLEDKSIRSKGAANRAAQEELRRRLGAADVTEIVAWDHENAPLGSVSPGDEILVQTGPEWTGGLALWSRVLSVTIEPETGVSRFSVVRTEKVTR